MGKMMRSVGTVIFSLQGFITSRTNASTVIAIRYTIYVYKFTFFIKSVFQIFNPLAELKAYNFYEEKVAHIIGI